jgi:hypothetical protein
VKIRHALACALLCVATSAHCLSADDLKWDLSYERALKAYPLPEDEWMRSWPGHYPSRPIHQRMADYRGEPIEASVLIEQLDGHTGAPSALWLIKTHGSAQVCQFHPKSQDQPCTTLDPSRAESRSRADCSH